MSWNELLHNPIFGYAGLTFFSILLIIVNMALKSRTVYALIVFLSMEGLFFYLYLTLPDVMTMMSGAAELGLVTIAAYFWAGIKVFTPILFSGYMCVEAFLDILSAERESVA